MAIVAAAPQNTNRAPSRSIKREPAPPAFGSLAQVRRAVPAVALILVRNDHDSGAPRPRGSAVIVRKDGLVATNYHVIQDSRSGRPYDEIFLSVSTDGAAASSSLNRYRLKAAMVNKQYDLALLRVDSEASGKSRLQSRSFPAVQFGDSKSLRILDDLFIIGFPEKGGLSVTVNRGTVEGKDILGNWIKTDGRMLHGNSGGAAVNRRGEFVGIPTKVVADTQPIDKDGDGLPEDIRVYGAVGFVRPAHLVAAMMAQLDERGLSGVQTLEAEPMLMESTAAVTVRGLVRSIADGRPVAGAVVGLLPAGTTKVTPESLLTWANADPDGRFVLNKPVPAARYSLRAKAIGFEASSREVVIDNRGSLLIVELKPISNR